MTYYYTYIYGNMKYVRSRFCEVLSYTYISLLQIMFITIVDITNNI